MKRDRSKDVRGVNVREKKDRRVVRTGKQIDAAFVELLHRRAYDDIRVSDITKKARVGRATFYAHYSSKDDLLRSQFARIVVPMLAVTSDDPCPLDATALFAHVQSAPQIYKGLVGAEAGGAPRVLQQCFEARLRQAIESQRSQFPPSREVDVDDTIIIRFLASGLLVVLESAVESRGRQTPREAQAIFAVLAGGALGAARTFGPKT